MFGMTSSPEGKDRTKYLPLLYGGVRYPRLARNLLENRREVIQRLYDPEELHKQAGTSTYRTFRPRFLNFLVEVETNNGQTKYICELRAVRDDDLTPYVLVAWCSEHYDLSTEDTPQSGDSNVKSDLEPLLAVATKAAVQHFRLQPGDLMKRARAFWCSANCMPYDRKVDEQGNKHRVEEGPERDALENQDVRAPQTLRLPQPHNLGSQGPSLIRLCCRHTV